MLAGGLWRALAGTLAGEEISLRTLVAAAIIIGSVVLLTSSRAEQKPVQPAKEAAPVRAEVVAESAPCK